MISYKLFKMRVNRILSKYLVSKVKCFSYRRKYHHLADVKKSIYITTDSIQYWYRGNRFGEITFPGEIRGGDWSRRMTPREKIVKKENPKFNGILQRYREGRRWIDTDLFKIYERKLGRGKRAKGYHRLEDLEEHYKRIYDSVFESLTRDGVLPSGNKNPGVAPIYVMLYKNGEILYTVDGNHRLYMCIAADIKEIPVRVWMRHKQWQEIREHILGRKGKNVDEEYRQFLDHPDIASELY